MSFPTQRTPRRAGFTLFELMLSITILSVVMGSIVMATKRGSGVFQRSMVNGQIDSQAGRAINRVVRELVGAGAIAPVPDPLFGADTIEFQRPIGWNAGAIVWGPTVRIGFELADGEVDNGVDDNRNGLIDEGRVVVTQDLGGADEKRVVLVNGVSELLEGEIANNLDDNGNGIADEAGLSFELEGDTLIVRLSVERPDPDLNNADGTARLLRRTLETAIALRNQ